MTKDPNIVVWELIINYIVESKINITKLRLGHKYTHTYTSFLILLFSCFSISISKLPNGVI